MAEGAISTSTSCIKLADLSLARNRRPVPIASASVRGAVSSAMTSTILHRARTVASKLIPSFWSRLRIPSITARASWSFDASSNTISAQTPSGNSRSWSTTDSRPTSWRSCFRTLLSSRLFMIHPGSARLSPQSQPSTSIQRLRGSSPVPLPPQSRDLEVPNGPVHSRPFHGEHRSDAISALRLLHDDTQWCAANSRVLCARHLVPPSRRAKHYRHETARSMSARRHCEAEILRA